MDQAKEKITCLINTLGKVIKGINKVGSNTSLRRDKASIKIETHINERWRMHFYRMLAYVIIVRMKQITSHNWNNEMKVNNYANLYTVER